jgi:quercetin dioxygenase-like cupin family protein
LVIRPGAYAYRLAPRSGAASYRWERFRMHKTIFKSSLLLMAMFVARTLCAEHADEGTGIYRADQMKWIDGPKSLPAGAKIAVLEGDPNKDGPFVMRLRLPDGYRIPAHTHPKTERLTVISGTFNIVMGEKLDEKDARKMPAGSFGYWPAGMKHAVWTNGETVVQLHGIGPWAIQYVNAADDPRNAAK